MDIKPVHLLESEFLSHKDPPYEREFEERLRFEALLTQIHPPPEALLPVIPFEAGDHFRWKISRTLLVVKQFTNALARKSGELDCVKAEG